MENKLICFRCGQYVDENCSKCNCGATIEEIIRASNQSHTAPEMNAENVQANSIRNSRSAPKQDVYCQQSAAGYTYQPAAGYVQQPYAEIDRRAIDELINRISMLQKQQNDMAKNFDARLKKQNKKRNTTIAVLGIIVGLLLIITSVCVAITIAATSETFENVAETVDFVHDTIEDIDTVQLDNLIDLINHFDEILYDTNSYSFEDDGNYFNSNDLDFYEDGKIYRYYRR